MQTHSSEIRLLDETPKKMTRRERTTQRILDAAMRLIDDNGFENLTIARLADELDYAVGALYRYFRGKDAILAALQVRCVEQIYCDIEAVLELARIHSEEEKLSEEDSSLLAAMCAAGAFESLSWRRPEESRLLAMSIGDPRPLITDELLDAGVLPVFRKAFGTLAKTIADAASAGALFKDDPTERAAVAWGATQGVMSTQKIGRVEASFSGRANVTALYKTMFIGWGAKREKVEAFLPLSADLLRRLGDGDVEQN